MKMWILLAAFDSTRVWLWNRLIYLVSDFFEMKVGPHQCVECRGVVGDERVVEIFSRQKKEGERMTGAWMNNDPHDSLIRQALENLSNC